MLAQDNTVPEGSPQIILHINIKQNCFWQEIVVLKRQQTHTLASSLEMYGFLTAAPFHIMLMNA